MVHITVPDQTPLIEYTATAAQTDFAFQFTFFDKSDLRVTVDQIELDQEEFEVAGTSGYEGGYPSGTVILDTGASAGAIVLIWSELKPVRINDFTEGGSMPARAVNTELDRLTARHRDVRLRYRRTPTISAPSDTQLSSIDAGQQWTNKGAGGTRIYTLPPASGGLRYIFSVVEAHILRIVTDPEESDTIYNGSVGATTLESSAIGSSCEIIGTETGTWAVLSSAGTWT